MWVKMVNCILWNILQNTVTHKPRTWGPGPRTWDPGPGTCNRDPGPGTCNPGPGTWDSRPRTPKSGTPGLWTFLLSFKIKRWKGRNYLQVNVIAQSILLVVKQLHDRTFCGVKNCFMKTYEFNKCTIRLKMQELRVVDFISYVITFVLAYSMN